jgi:predicted GIY-YIG superfamily endonuclease
MHCAYILRCADGSLYIGSTDDLEGRLRRHDEGRGATSTARRLPVPLVFSEERMARVELYANDSRIAILQNGTTLPVS